MAPIFFALIATALLLLVIALFARGGAGETRPLRRAAGGAHGAALVEETQQVLSSMGYTIGSVASTPSGRVDIVARDPRPLAGQVIYVRVFPDEPDPVGVSEVQAALDRLKEGFHKAVLISSAGFTNEGVVTAEDTAVELIDAPRLSELKAQLAPRPPRTSGLAAPPMTQGDVPA